MRSYNAIGAMDFEPNDSAKVALVQIRPPQLQFISFQLFPSTPQPRPRDSSGRNGSKSESKEKQNYGMAEETKKRLAPLRDRQAF